MVVLNKWKNEETIITSVFFILLFIASIGMYGFVRSKLNPMKKSIVKQVVVIVIIGIVITYALGAFTGFLKNGYSLAFINIIKNTLAPILIIVFMELFRYNIIRANKNQFKVVVMVTLLLTLLEIQMSIIIVGQLNLRELFIVSTTIVIPIIVKNMLLSYLSYEVGYQPCILYRLLYELYIYFVPYMPNLKDYLTSMFGLCLPTIVFAYSSRIIEEQEEGVEEEFMTKRSRLLDIPIYTIIVIVIALISRVFPIFAIGVGSESMTGALNKGDAVIAYKVKEENIEVNDVIVFQTQDKILIHRVVEIEEIDGIKHYRTKGDMNGTRDNVDVTMEKIYGEVKYRIPYIAYPSIWLTELLKN